MRDVIVSMNIGYLAWDQLIPVALHGRYVLKPLYHTGAYWSSGRRT